MPELDEQEVKIIRELIRNPRISDNKISKRTGVPVMTVNRKRKNLEATGMISYYADLRHGKGGTDDFYAKQMYIIKFKIGMTSKGFMDKLRSDKTLRKFNAEHIVSSNLCEKEGHLALMMVVNAHTEQSLNESFNGQIVPTLKRNYGDDCIKKIETIRILEPLREHHNYLHQINMKEAIIDENWPDEYIFIDRKSFHKPKEGTLSNHF